MRFPISVINEWLFGYESDWSKNSQSPAIDWYSKQPVHIRYASKRNPYGLMKMTHCRFRFLHKWVYITHKHPAGHWVTRICRRCGLHEEYTDYG